ncbi:MAG TPA: hypothetical protein VF170_13435, partial [Planctomycetaceae bacterium]
MRLSREAWRQLRPLFAAGTGLEFDYHGRHRFGVLDTVGEGPQGAFFTLRHPDGAYKSYSLAKVENLRVGRFLPSPM